MSQSCRHDVFDPTSTIRLRSDSEGVFVRCAECNKAQHWTADYDDDTEPTAGPTAVERAVCPHGSLRRQCEVCERDEEIARLAKKLRIAELKASGTLATNLCPDHHDKQLGKPCLACEIERLNKWADGFADRQLEERRTAEAYQRELRAEIDRLRAELKAATESEYAFCVERDQLRAEVGKLRAAVCVLCERDGGVCAMGTHEADDDPCTPENCSTMRAVETHGAPSKPMCKHEWVGDDNCAYCRAEEAEGELERMKSELADHMWWERTAGPLQEQRNAAYAILERWLAIFEAAGAPVASGDPENHPILSVMGDTRRLLRERPSDETYADSLRAEVERLRYALEMAARRFEYIAAGASSEIANAPTGAKEAREALERAPAADETPPNHFLHCSNFPCQLPSGHQGPCVSDPDSEDVR